MIPEGRLTRLEFKEELKLETALRLTESREGLARIKLLPRMKLLLRRGSAVKLSSEIKSPSDVNAFVIGNAFFLLEKARHL